MAESSSSLYADVMVSAPEIPLITRCINGQHARDLFYELFPISETAIAPVPVSNAPINHGESPEILRDFPGALCVFSWTSP
jgi:hypothetical protein